MFQVVIVMPTNRLAFCKAEQNIERYVKLQVPMFGTELRAAQYPGEQVQKLGRESGDKQLREAHRHRSVRRCAVQRPRRSNACRYRGVAQGCLGRHRHVSWVRNSMNMYVVACEYVSSRLAGGWISKRAAMITIWHS